MTIYSGVILSSYPSLFKPDRNQEASRSGYPFISLQLKSNDIVIMAAFDLLSLCETGALA